jgi:membrane protease YdiL (CAAX protease family)
VVQALALALFLSPIEEFGWRGLALPLLQKWITLFWAALVLGTIWIMWHTPAYLIGGTLQSDWAFASFFVGGVAGSLIMTALLLMILLEAFCSHFALFSDE